MEKVFATFLSIIVFSLLFFSATGYAVIIESGDGGATFAADLSVKMCKQKNVSSVQICNGNIVKVVSSIPGEGVTFYKPDGAIVHCPENLTPSEMGAACTQLLMQPNMCPTKSVCTPPPENKTTTTKPATGDQNKTATGVGIPDIEPNMSTPERVEPPETEGGLEEEVFIFAVIVVGMVAVAIINYLYFKSKGT